MCARASPWVLITVLPWPGHLSGSGHGTLAPENCLLAAVFWPVAAGPWPLGRWPLAAGPWSLAVGRWPCRVLELLLLPPLLWLGLALLLRFLPLLLLRLLLLLFRRPVKAVAILAASTTLSLPPAGISGRCRGSFFGLN